MIDGLKPYPEYKDSALALLGQIPIHWDAHSLRTLIRARNERNQPNLPLLSVVREKGVILRSTMTLEENRNFVPDDLSNYKVVRYGDLVINKMKAWQGSLGIAPCDGIVSPAYFVFDFRFSDRAYGQALLRSRPYVEHFARASDGVRIGQWDLSIAGMRQIPVVVPPHNEQKSIVRFLDHASRRIERFIRAKRKLITLLNEQKQTVIHGAVTRGLDLNVRLKPSGMEWLGDVPQHWEAVSLRRYWEVIDCKHLTVPFVEEGIPLASVVEVQSFYLNLSKCKKTTPHWYRLLLEGGRKPKRDDVIYCRNASVGAAAYVDADMDIAMGQDVCLIRSANQNQLFLNFVLHSPFMKHQLEQILVGSTFKRINISEIKALRVIVPPKAEQDQICDALSSQLERFDQAIARAEKELSLMREYRARLVADVVTGQLDVREVAARLPEETQKPEPSFADAEDALGIEVADKPVEAEA